MYRVIRAGQDVSITMDQQAMLAYLHALDNKLRQADMTCEIEMFGGAVMCLGLNARESTHDIDALFEPKTEVRTLIAEVAKENGLPADWMNDSVKGFVSDKENTVIRYDDSEFTNLTIFMASPEYMFAMKCLSARLNYENATEMKDILFLIDYLKINSADEAFDIIAKYYPNNLVRPKTQYLIEELFDEDQQ